MDKFKIIIIILIILLIISISIFLTLKNKSDNPYKGITEEEDIPQDTFVETDENILKEKDGNVFFSVGDMIQLMFDYISEDNKEAIYNITNKEYIKNNNISLGNCILLYANTKNKINYYGQEIYTKINSNNMIYYTYGYLLEEGKELLQDYYLKVIVDINRNTFSVEPLLLEEYNEKKNGNIEQIEKIDIEKNVYNIYALKNLFSEELVKRYMNDYILKLNYKPDQAYDILEEHYKNENFSSEESFKQYIETNKNRFEDFTIQSYQSEIQKDSIQYTVLDQKNNSYKIIVYNALEYRIVM